MDHKCEIMQKHDQKITRRTKQQNKDLNLECNSKIREYSIGKQLSKNVI